MSFLIRKPVTLLVQCSWLFEEAVYFYFLPLSFQKFLVYTHFIDLGKMKDWVDLGATQCFWTRDLWMGIQCLNHWAIAPSMCLFCKNQKCPFIPRIALLFSRSAFLFPRSVFLFNVFVFRIFFSPGDCNHCCEL